MLNKFSHDEVATTRALIWLEYDAIEAYKAAIERLDSHLYKTKLEEFLADHRTHVADLTRYMHDLGESAPTDGDVKSMLTVGKVVVGNFIGDKTILKAMKSNEEEINTAYEEAARECGGKLQVIIEKNLLDEIRHKTWLTSETENE